MASGRWAAEDDMLYSAYRTTISVIFHRKRINIGCFDTYFLVCFAVSGDLCWLWLKTTEVKFCLIFVKEKLSGQFQIPISKTVYTFIIKLCLHDTNLMQYKVNVKKMLECVDSDQYIFTLDVGRRTDCDQWKSKLGSTHGGNVACSLFISNGARTTKRQSRVSPLPSHTWH